MFKEGDLLKFKTNGHYEQRRIESIRQPHKLPVKVAGEEIYLEGIYYLEGGLGLPFESPAIFKEVIKNER